MYSAAATDDDDENADDEEGGGFDDEDDDAEADNELGDKEEEEEEEDEEGPPGAIFACTTQRVEPGCEYTPLYFDTRWPGMLIRRCLILATIAEPSLASPPLDEPTP